MIRDIFKRKKNVFIPFIMAGHPSLETSKKALIALSEAGADLIELGVPFSDPVADGPVNQQAADIALNQGVTIHDIFSMIKSLRQEGLQTPIVLFTYFNPLLNLGIDVFIKLAKDAGINGVLIVDLPPEEGFDFYQTLQASNIEIVLLSSPTTKPQRFHLYQQLNPSFLYYISRLSVTGIQGDLSENLKNEVRELRHHFPNTSIAVGFGISNPNQAATVAQFADGVIIGSRLVQTLEKEGIEAFRVLAQSLQRAISNPEDLV